MVAIGGKDRAPATGRMKQQAKAEKKQIPTQASSNAEQTEVHIELLITYHKDYLTKEGQHTPEVLPSSPYSAAKQHKATEYAPDCSDCTHQDKA